MDFYRYHGLGNDYLVMDPAQTALKLTPERIRLICDRHFGVGSDGILYGPVLDDSGEMSLRIFNPDGSEAEKSGNGVRIFSRYLVDQGYRSVGQTFPIRTKGGLVQSTVHDPRRRIQVEMGRATFKSNEIPVTLAGQPREVVNEPLLAGGTELAVTCVSVGNPHCVVPLPAVSPDRALALGPEIEKHPFFPHRTNVQFLQVLDRNNIRIEIWERGAGYTLASGSSSCAAAAAAHKLGLVDQNVTVHMPGGTLAIIIGPDYQMEMTGPVEAIAAGNFLPDFISALEQPLGK